MAKFVVLLLFSNSVFSFSALMSLKCQSIKRRNTLNNRFSKPAPLVLFLLLATSFPLPAQSAFTKVSNEQLSPAGTTVLTSPAGGAKFSDDLRTKMSDDADEMEETPSAPSPLTFPTPSPQAISSLTSGFFGFAGLSHFDQRTAGTGNFANTQFSVEPPDQGLAAGNGFILEAVNDALAVFSQATGQRLVGPTPLNQFFNLAPEVIRGSSPVFGDFVSDPKCYFDPQTQRWFVTALQIDVVPATGALANRSHLLLAVSQSADPTQGFNLFKLDTTDDGTNGTQSHANCPCFGDQPLIGADAHGFFVSTNEFAIHAGPLVINRTQIYAMSKTQLSQGVLPTVVHLSGLSVPNGGRAFSVQPATSPDLQEYDGDNGGTEFFVSSFNTRVFFNNQVTVWALTNTSSLDQTAPNVNLINLAINSETYSVPPDATQKPGPIPLGSMVGNPEEFVATNEHRMQQVVFAHGKLWSAVTTGIQQGQNVLAGIAFFIVQPSTGGGTLSAKVTNQGYVSVQNENVFFPSIGVSDDGKAVMTFSLSGPDFFPSVGFSQIDAENGAGNVQIAAPGVAPEDGFSGYPAFGFRGVARWGDYSAAVADGDTIWFAAEFIPGGTRTALADWGTFIGSLPID